MMANSAPEIKWDISVDEIKIYKNDLIKDCNARCDDIAKTTDLTYENVLVALNELDIVFDNGSNYLKILHLVSLDGAVRDAANEALAEISKFGIEMKMRKDLYDICKTFGENNFDKLDNESKRYIERTLIEGKHYGLHLNEETRNKVKEIKQKLSDYEIKYLKNLHVDNTRLPFKKEDLDGLSDDILNSLEKNEKDEYIVTMQYPVFYPLLRDCKVPETRRKVFLAFLKRRADENVKLFDDVLELRHDLASLLGYKTYADYALELCMTKNAETVENFLNNLAKKFMRILEKEYEISLKYKKEEYERLNRPFDGKLYQSELKYYHNMREKLELNVDQNKLKEYFPLDVVLNGIFSIYQTILGLEFELINKQHYHEEIKQYVVRDKETKELMGYFYIDIHPREGKFGHSANFPIFKGCRRSDGTRQVPVCNMLCNLTKPTGDKPALLYHDEVEIFFHEFGHVMHHMCAKTNFCKLSGTSVETDFVEAPSQMLENWIWEKESLKLMSRHYQDGSPISDHLLESLAKSRSAKAGHFIYDDILLSLIDIIYHTNRKPDTRITYQQKLKEIMKLDAEDESLNNISQFGHIMAGYDARYYSYLWSEVLSSDMFATRFKKEGVLNSKTGMDYRRCILQPGGTMDANEMLFNFLGHKPNQNGSFVLRGIHID